MPKPTISHERAALSPREFAALFGKEQTWGYRQIYSGKVKTITEYGRILVPAAEVERILGEAGTYNGSKKVKLPKEAGKLKAWQKFIVHRRKAVSPATAAKGVSVAARLQPAHDDASRAAAIARLGKRSATGR